MALYRCILLSTLLVSVFASVQWRAPNEDKLDWWQDTVIYQIFPKSFKDSDGDGIGDLQGIINNLDYIQNLGVKTIWISSLYESQGVDSGYDVTNFTNIDPIFGTLDDFKDLLKVLKDKKMKLIMDFVPNHSSDQHEWFQKAIKNDTEYRDYYVWANPKMDILTYPPNNWLSVYGGSAWSYDDNSNQYYLHQFSYKQPDFNWRNDNLTEKIWETMKYWLDMGVNGFGMRSVNLMYEDKDLQKEDILVGITSCGQYKCLNHTRTRDQPEVFERLAYFRRRLDEYSTSGEARILITEAYTNVEEAVKYYGFANTSSGIAHIPLNFNLAGELEPGADVFFTAISTWMDSLPVGAWPNWMIGNQDLSRVATRHGPYLADALQMIMLLLPGTPITYYGEEIGMEDTNITYDKIKDLKGRMAGPDSYLEAARDFQRTPFQWNSKNFSGFSNGNNTWLPVNPNYQILNIEDQKFMSSHLTIYKSLVALRSDPSIQKGDTVMEVIGARVLAFKRFVRGHDEGIVVAVNFGEDELEYINLETALHIHDTRLTVLVTGNRTIYDVGDELDPSSISLEPNDGVVFSFTPLFTSSSSLSTACFTLMSALAIALRYMR